MNNHAALHLNYDVCYGDQSRSSGIMHVCPCLLFQLDCRGQLTDVLLPEACRALQ
jgi:hypothetical protein